MLRALMTRLAGTLIVLFGVTLLVFLLAHIIPGDPVEVMLGEHAAAADRQALRESLGLDRPLARQLAQYYAALIQGDLGYSLYNRQAVSDLIVERLPATLQLSLAAILVALLLAVPAGVIAAARHGRLPDRLVSGVSMFGLSVPNFVFGPLLMLVFAVWLGWLPVSGQEGPGSLVLPALTLGTALAAMLMRMLRSSLLEVLGEDYVRSARARGLSPLRVLLRHALRNAWLPVLTLLGLQLGALLAGAVITETVFNWPGIGLLTVEAIEKRDYPLIQGCVLFISVVYVGVNLLTDLVYLWADPRLRTQEVARQTQ
ncbi:MAG: ABC transporter permease [Granulosicoccaceae bacterium]|jgi:peptide/nickel transport system permease protein